MVSEKNIKQKRSMKKAQAAMEFLMTYSWAILAVLIVIGALATFGVFEFGNLIPDRCVLAHPLQCDEHVLSVDSDNNVTARLSVSSNDQKEITIRRIALGTGDESVLNGNCFAMAYSDYSNTSSPPPIITRTGGAATIQMNNISNCTMDIGSVGQKNKHVITVFYDYGTTDFTRPSVGELITTAQR